MNIELFLAAASAAQSLKDVLGSAVFIIQVVSAVACLGFLVGAIIKAKREQSFDGVGFSVFVAVACAASFAIITLIWNKVGIDLANTITNQTGF